MQTRHQNFYRQRHEDTFTMKLIACILAVVWLAVQVSASSVSNSTFRITIYFWLIDFFLYKREVLHVQHLVDLTVNRNFETDLWIRSLLLFLFIIISLLATVNKMNSWINIWLDRIRKLDFLFIYSTVISGFYPCDRFYPSQVNAIVQIKPISSRSD